MNLESSETDELLPIYKDDSLNERLYIDRNLDIDNSIPLSGLRKRCRLFFFNKKECFIIA